jgi:ABC-2 type transport system ATP-binding protein
MNAINVSQLSITFGKKIVLSNLNFELAEGAIAHVTGDNGAGKSSLLKALAGIIEPTQGKIRFLEQDRNLKLIGYNSSNVDCLFSRLTGRENVALFKRLRGIEKDPGHTPEFLEVEIFRDALATPFYKCSTGMKRLLSLYISMIHAPPVMLWDEPFLGLSQQTLAAITPALKKILKDRSALIVHHGHLPTFSVDALQLEIKNGGLCLQN